MFTMKTVDDKDKVPNQDSKYNLPSDDRKVEVPAQLLKALDEVIDGLIKDAKDHDIQAPHAFYNFEMMRFYNDTADAFKHLKELMKEGTVHSLKKAQIFASSLMSPMQLRIPSEVWLFLVAYEGKKSLKTKFNEILKSKKK